MNTHSGHRDRFRIAIDAAKQRKEPLDHALFFGPPGLGKTTPAGPRGVPPCGSGWRSRGTPRIANGLLRRVRDYAAVRADGTVTREVAQVALQRLDVDEFGLDDMDARFLHRTPRGRVATAAAYRHFGFTAPKGQDTLFGQ